MPLRLMVDSTAVWVDGNCEDMLLFRFRDGVEGVEGVFGSSLTLSVRSDIVQLPSQKGSRDYRRICKEVMALANPG
jgi:hypothetical protein